MEQEDEMKTWEYRIVMHRKVPTKELEAELNRLGKEGWEVASSDMEVKEDDEHLVVYYHALLKRELS
jgi:hypothetical protein